MSINLEPEYLPVISDEEQALIAAVDAALLEEQYGEISPMTLSDDFMEKFTKFTNATSEITEEFQKALAPFVTIPKIEVEVSEDSSLNFWNNL